VKLRIQCPECHQWTVTEQIAAGSWACSGCGFNIAAAPETAASPELRQCRLCGNDELYVQKDFPHWLGMGILVAACVASVVTYALRWITATWCILIGSALLDGLMYLAMGSVTVCYRCRTHHRGFPPNAQHGPFNLATGEKYRQERIRREELAKRTK
jgi:uncharacterized protein (DUF983 family)